MSDLGSGLMLMAIGMGTVFLFLTLLIGATELLHKFAGQPDATPTATPPTGTGERSQSPLAAVATPSDDATLTAVITAAITAYRNDPKR